MANSGDESEDFLTARKKSEHASPEPRRKTPARTRSVTTPVHKSTTARSERCEQLEKEDFLTGLMPGETIEVQGKRCAAARYAGFAKCRSCATHKQEHCRFRRARRFALAKDGSVARVLGSFESGSGYVLQAAASELQCPSEQSKSLARYVLAHVGPIFERLVREEIMSHGNHVVVATAQAPGASADPDKDPKCAAGLSVASLRAPGERQLCDVCSSTIFHRYSFCARCGFEVCVQCELDWQADGRPTGTEGRGLCQHQLRDWRHFSKIAPKRIAALRRSVAEGLATIPATGGEEGEWGRSGVERPELSGRAPSCGIKSGLARPLFPTDGAGSSEVGTRFEPRRLDVAAADKFESAFLAMWKRGEVVLVRNVRMRQQWTPARFSELYGDEAVQLVDVRSGVEFEAPLRDMLRGFASPALRPTFGRDGSGDAWERLVKIKDWPPTTHFQALLPEHYRDFQAALPMAQYSARDGPLNLASMLPPSALPPDLGPKMYLAYGCIRPDEPSTFVSSARGAGTTYLHCDMSDAVNICVYVERERGAGGSEVGSGAAESRGAGSMEQPRQPTGGRKRQRAQQGDSSVPRAKVPACDAGSSSGTRAQESCVDEQGREVEDAAGVVLAGADADADEEAEYAADDDWLLSEGPTASAVWDVWRAEDAAALRDLLFKFASEEGRKAIDPIHDGTFFVDHALRRRLRREYGVRGWRFVQHEGEAVFLPAGTPHQVRNLRSSIKVAADFVSPEHISRCLELTQTWRQLPRSHRQNHDPLGTKDLILHATSHATSVLFPPVLPAAVSRKKDAPVAGARHPAPASQSGQRTDQQKRAGKPMARPSCGEREARLAREAAAMGLPVTQCEKNTRCVRGFKHGGRGGWCNVPSGETW